MADHDRGHASHESHRVHVLEVVDHPSPGARAALYAGVSPLAVKIPRFPTACVCCNGRADRRHAYDASEDETTMDPIMLPVCRACDEHGFVPARQSGPSWAWLIGLAMLAAPLLIPGPLPASLRMLGMIPGALAIGYAIWRGRRLRARMRELGRDGHHGDLELWIAGGRLRIKTSNTLLATRLRELNDDVLGG